MNDYPGLALFGCVILYIVIVFGSVIMTGTLASNMVHDVKAMKGKK